MEKEQELNLDCFGIGLSDNLNDKPTKELYELLHKARSKVFDKQGKILRQTLSVEEKAERKLKKFINDADMTDAEKLTVLKKSLEGKE